MVNVQLLKKLIQKDAVKIKPKARVPKGDHYQTRMLVGEQRASYKGSQTDLGNSS
jgi:hypothetical protein